MTPEEVRLLFDYNSWANQRSLEASSQLSDEQFIKPLGSSFPSVRDTLVHICGAEWVWLERCHGRSPASIPDISQVRSMAALREHWKPQAERLLIFIRGLTQDDLDRVMQHLANHGTYHRGQITTLLRQLGTKPILTDLLHFYRERSTTPSS